MHTLAHHTKRLQCSKQISHSNDAGQSNIIERSACRTNIRNEIKQDNFIWITLLHRLEHVECVPFFVLKPQHVIYSTIHAINVYIFASMNLFCPKKCTILNCARARTQCKCMNRNDTLTHRWIQNNASRLEPCCTERPLATAKELESNSRVCNQMNENWIWIQTKWKSWMWISINWSKWVNVYGYACGWTLNMRMCTMHSDQRRHIHRVWIKNFPFNPLHRRHYYYYRRRCRHFFDYMLVLHIWMDHLMHWNSSIEPLI